VGIRDGYETIHVEMKENSGEKDAKDSNECLFGEEENRKLDVKGRDKHLIGDEEIWMEDTNIFAIHLLHEKKRYFIKKIKVRETQGASKNIQVIEEFEKLIILKDRREAANRFKEKASE